MFEDLLSILSIALYSLQVGKDAAAVAEFRAKPQLVDLNSRIHDFVDTAVLISQLDLVIAVDTAVAHLAELWANQYGCCCLLSQIGDGSWSARIVLGLEQCVCFVSVALGIGKVSLRQ